AAIRDDAGNERATARLAQLLTAAGRYPELAELHLAVLATLGPAAPDGKNPERLRRWSELTELYGQHLDRLDDAVVAAEVTMQLAPGDRSRRRLLAELCEHACKPQRGRAMACVEQLLDDDPGDRDAYRALERLCRDSGDSERAAAAAAAI